MKQPLAIAPFFVNTVPKSGSHLLRQILLGLPDMKHEWSKHWYFEGYPSQYKDFKTRFKTLRTNEVAFGHLYYADLWKDFFNEWGMKRMFLYRDPRDIVVSFVYYILNSQRNNPSYTYLAHRCSTQKERYKAIIEGFKSGSHERPGITEWYERFIKWKNDSNALVLRFEDLVGGHRFEELKKIQQYLLPEITEQALAKKMILQMDQNIRPEESLTFRRGKVGSWKDEFDDELKELTHRLCGSLLKELDYAPTQ
jgi:sulfotransferase 6B1